MKAVTDGNLAVDFVRLGAQPVDTGTLGTVYFDDPSTISTYQLKAGFESHRFLVMVRRSGQNRSKRILQRKVVDTPAKRLPADGKWTPAPTAGAV
jgi:hypothetical protein